MNTDFAFSLHFSDETVAWFAGISEHNSKEFFSSHKERYMHAVREPFAELLDALASDFGGIPYIFRPNRDTRFSKDKRPYKTVISGYLGGRPDTTAAMYLELSAGGLMAATGYHVMAADQLERFRLLLTSDQAPMFGSELLAIMKKLDFNGYEVRGDQLKTAPKGIDRNELYIDLLRYKAMTIRSTLPIDEAQDAKAAYVFCKKTWEQGSELNAWFDMNVGSSVITETIG